MPRRLAASLRNISSRMSASLPRRRPSRTIIDTDIGTEADDIFAIALALRCPELKVELITTATGNTKKRAQIVCKLLCAAQRDDIHVGIGNHAPSDPIHQWDWAADFDMAMYKGCLFKDGIAALRDVLRTATEAEPILILALAPLTNIAAVLRMDPDLARSTNIRLVAMAGSVRVGYNGWAPPDIENNIMRDISAAQRSFRVQWPISLAPLDACMQGELRGERFASLRASADPLCRAVVESYDVWVGGSDAQWSDYPTLDFTKETTTLYDTVAVLCAAQPGTSWLCWETLRLIISDQGMTKESKTTQGVSVQVATGWHSLDAFLDWLSQRLSGQSLTEPSAKRRKYSIFGSQQ
eukprot:TRINITY_DN46832_c0_g1_i1.p1 TRINITY_DN46832_c0_g1~~TRINITY_DN46832_c0_g1_i1.p1  ORF type:complete len:353 (-),score=24.89 TRINITY_DN46832_c0_g1_i1:91-1149(-)